MQDVKFPVFKPTVNVFYRNVLAGKQWTSLSLQSVSLSIGLFIIKCKGNYKEMATQMCLMEIGHDHRCAGDRCEEQQFTRPDWWADRRTEGEIEFDSDVWLAWLAIEKKRTHRARHSQMGMRKHDLIWLMVL